MKRSAVVVALAGMLFAMLGVIAPASSNASSGAVVCKLKGGNKVVCPTSKLRGPRGPAGAQGPAGPQGPAGSGATSVSPFKFLAVGNTPNTTIFTFTGAVAEAGCQGGAFTNNRLRATADNGSAEIINFNSTIPDTEFDFDTGENIPLDDPVDDMYGLTYMSAGGAQNASAHYYSNDGAAIAGVYDCAVYGTVSVS